MLGWPTMDCESLSHNRAAIQHQTALSLGGSYPYNGVIVCPITSETPNGASLTRGASLTLFEGTAIDD